MSDITYFNPNLIPLDGLNLTTDQKDRIVMTLQGRSLKNPVSGIINQTKLEVDRLEVVIRDAAVDVKQREDTLPTPIYNASHPYWPIPSTKLFLYADTLKAYSSALVTYKSHSDILSGVNLNYAGFPPNFLGRIGIAQAYNILKESIRTRETQDCSEGKRQEIFSKVFHSILGYAEREIQEVYDLILNSDEQITSITQSNIGGLQTRESLIDNFTSRVSQSSSKLAQFKQIDDQGFFEAYNFVTNVSLAQSLLGIKSDPYAKKLLEEVNGTDLFNKDDISKLRLRCQPFTIQNTSPDTGFETEFMTVFQSSLLGDLADVSIANVATGQYLRLDSSGMWVGATLAGGGGGVTDHGDLTGLSDDDHPQYAQIAASESITGTWSFVTAPLTDTIGERTSGAGVTIDGLLIKDGGIPQSAVTAHQAALSITESQISNLQNYALVGHTHTASNITDFTTSVDARISAAVLNDLSNVTAPSPSANNVLKFNGSVWVPGSVAYSEVSGTPSLSGFVTVGDLAGFATVGHIHPEYITSGDLAGFATVGHIHTLSQIADAGSAAAANTGDFAAASHSHSATDISSGTLPVIRGGTGTDTLPALPDNYTTLAGTVSGHLSGIDTAFGVALRQRIGGGFDGGGATVASGVALRVPVMQAATITAARMVADQSGTLSVIVKHYAAADTTLSTPTTITTVTISSAVVASVTGLSYSVTVGDHIEFVTDGTTIDIERVSIVLNARR